MHDNAREMFFVATQSASDSGNVSFHGFVDSIGFIHACNAGKRKPRPNGKDGGSTTMV